MLDGKKLVRCALVLVLAFTMILTPQFTVPASAAKSISQLQNEQADLKKQQAANTAKLASLKADKAKKVEYQQALDAQVKTVQSQIDVYNAQIAASDEAIAQTQAQIATKQNSINENVTKFKERLRAMYLTGEASNLEIILSATNIMDLADKTEVISAITTHDTQLIDKIKVDMNAVKDQQAVIQTNRKDAATAKVGLDTKQSELTGLINESQKAIADISANESAANTEKKNLATESAQADAAVDQYFKDYYAEQARLAAANGGGNSGGSGGYQSKGNFTWPVPGVTTLSSPFGPRPEGYHKGIDIASSGIYGKPIVAADSGKVIQASFGINGNGYNGYGNVVVIDHGNGYSTLYAHCSSIAVSAGSMVTKGQVIAYVGSTGNSTGPHLHFEIRVNGVANNPMNWFGR